LSNSRISGPATVAPGSEMWSGERRANVGTCLPKISSILAPPDFPWGGTEHGWAALARTGAASIFKGPPSFDSRFSKPSALALVFLQARWTPAFEEACVHSPNRAHLAQLLLPLRDTDEEDVAQRLAAVLIARAQFRGTVPTHSRSHPAPPSSAYRSNSSSRP
jgi:hypothetical protein